MRRWLCFVDVNAVLGGACVAALLAVGCSAVPEAGEDGNDDLGSQGPGMAAGTSGAALGQYIYDLMVSEGMRR